MCLIFPCVNAFVSSWRSAETPLGNSKEERDVSSAKLCRSATHSEWLQWGCIGFYPLVRARPKYREWPNFPFPICICITSLMISWKMNTYVISNSPSKFMKRFTKNKRGCDLAAVPVLLGKNHVKCYQWRQHYKVTALLKIHKWNAIKLI